MATLNVTRGPNWDRMSHEVRSAVHGGWVERCARIGYGARGVVYAIIGYLALQLALGEGGRTTGAHGALARVSAQPFGVVLLALLAVGLVGFVAWRWVEAFVDPEHEGTRGKALVKRAGFFLSGAIYAGLAISAVERILGRADHGSDSARGWTAKLLAQPLGQVLVAIVGVGFMVFAVKELHKAYTQSFSRKLDLHRLSPQRAHWVVRLSQFGLAARATVFLLMGGFLIRAAITANPREAKGLGEALATLARQPFGAVLLGVTSAGLLAYALYQFVVARYRHMAPAR